MTKPYWREYGTFIAKIHPSAKGHQHRGYTNPLQKVLAQKLYGKIDKQNLNRVAGEGGAGGGGFAPELV